MVKRFCNVCGDEFEAKSSRERYCKKEKVTHCSYCGKEIHYSCTGHIPTTCSRSCSAKLGPKKKRICKRCGKEFQPHNANQFYCNEEVVETCPICGEKFTYKCTKFHIPKTCGSRKCSAQSSKIGREEFYSKEIRVCDLCGKKFKPRSNTQRICDSRYHKFKCVICGKEFDAEASKMLSGYRTTCSIKCEHILRVKNNGMKKPETVEKVFSTYRENHPGYDHQMHNPKSKKKLVDTYKSRTGYDHPSHNPESRSRAARNRKVSKLEQRIRNLLETYKIEYIHHFFLKNADLSHEFDFYIPKYKILMDADGVYFHSYLSDPDGKFVGDQYDPVRMSLIPEDHIFILAVEGYEEKHIKELHDIIKQMDEGVYDYDSELFKWCRTIEFPYPEYSKKRMLGDWNSLKSRVNLDKYAHNCRYCNSIIQNFHRSIYDCKVGLGPNTMTPVQAWNNDNLLKKVIENRLIYKNEVDPSKILAGFNISKKCPRVSLFNPVLARYLTEKYLSEFNEVFDPFSGFSGRLLGVEASRKHYIGQDLNEKCVNESKEILKFLGLDSELSVKDIFESSGKYECLLTCPPYGTKEIYSKETVFKSCDDWISECLNRFICKRYVFVVDETEKYKDNIVQEISNSSHFSKAKEYVIVIDL